MSYVDENKKTRIKGENNRHQTTRPERTSPSAAAGCRRRSGGGEEQEEEVAPVAALRETGLVCHGTLLDYLFQVFIFGLLDL